MHELDRLRDAQITGRTLFLGASMRVFLGEIHTRIGEGSKAGGLPQSRGASSNPQRAGLESLCLS